MSPGLAGPCQIAASVVLYCLAASAVPIYNKLIFNEGVGGRRFAYPLALAMLQLGFVSGERYDFGRLYCNVEVATSTMASTS